MRGIKLEIYPKERGIHAFQAPYTIQKHGDKKNPHDELLLADLKKISSPRFVNSWSSD
jgi:hypothetical protein